MTGRTRGSLRAWPSSISSRFDDWLLAPLTDAERRDLLAVIEDRSERRSTLIASQLPPTAWHAAIGEPSVADAICDRVMHRAHKLTLKGPTMRDPDTRRGGKGKS
jgi:DNA replication protein DnaC